MHRSVPLVSVIICTYDPNEHTLDWVLANLAQQTLSSREFEVVVVDNNSPKPLQAEPLQRGRSLNLRVVREPRQGQLYARCRGIMESAAPLLVFVDDDNGLAANYLEEAARISRQEPGLGAFGGITKLLTDLRIPEWKIKLLPYLGVRDYGPKPITSNRTEWGEWEPIGAGMVFRRDVGLKFVEAAETEPEARNLGRRGGSYIGGEDSFLARVACQAGYSCSYQPSLQLTHFIKGSRMRARALAKTIQGCAESWVINERLCGRPPIRPSWFGILRELYVRLRYRTRQRGFKQGAVEWFWDVGYFRQVRATACRATSVRTNPRQHSARTGG